MRGYLDVHPNGPLELAGGRGFTFRSSLSTTDDNLPFYRCNDDPIHCVPGAAFNVHAAAVPQSGTGTIDGATHRLGQQSDASLAVSFDGSVVVLPPLAPAAVVTAPFTFSGTFRHPGAGGTAAVNEEPLSGSGLVDVYLHSPASPDFPNSWHVDRIVYRLDAAPIPGLWVYTDIGAVGRPGISRFSGGEFLVSGSGADIWGAADTFHYLYRALEGDGDVAARVRSFSASQPFAKAGVMLRQSGSTGSAHVLLDVKPDGGIEFLTRAANGGTTTFIAGATATLPVWLRLTRQANSVTALRSSDGVSWNVVGSTTLTGTWGSLMGGLAVTSHDNASVAQSVFDEPSVGLDWPWQHADIGLVGQTGDSAFIHGSYLVSGSGADIWGSADAFHYLYQPHMGDGQIIARVDDEDDTSPFAKTGVMIRDSLSPQSAHVVLDVRPNGAVEFMSRLTNGGSTNYIAGATRAFPVWLKLERRGNSVIGSTSADGSAWTIIGSVDVASSLFTSVGVAVTSHDTSVTNTASIGLIDTRTGVTPPSGLPNVVVYANDVATANVHGVFAKVSDTTAAAGVTLSTPAGGASNGGSALAAPADYVDIPFRTATNTRYTLWIRARATNNSKFSDSLWVQFSDAQAGGAGVYPIGTTSALLVNLATDGNAASLRNWGWANGAYWLSQPATFTFSTVDHTLRIQPREYGVEIDQIVLSPSNYLNPAASCPDACDFAPGAVSNDATVVPKP